MVILGGIKKKIIKRESDNCWLNLEYRVEGEKKIRRHLLITEIVKVLQDHAHMTSKNCYLKTPALGFLFHTVKFFSLKLLSLSHEVIKSIRLRSCRKCLHSFSQCQSIPSAWLLWHKIICFSNPSIFFLAFRFFDVAAVMGCVNLKLITSKVKP